MDYLRELADGLDELTHRMTSALGDFRGRVLVALDAAQDQPAGHADDRARATDAALGHPQPGVQSHHPDVIGGEERIADTLDFLEERLGLLVSRLEPVLAPPRGDGAAIGAELTPGFETAPLASILYKHGARVARAGERVDYLISRLEV